MELEIKPATVGTVTMKATNDVTPIIAIASLKVTTVEYLKNFTIEKNRFSVRRKMLPVVAMTRNVHAVRHVLHSEL